MVLRKERLEIGQSLLRRFQVLLNFPGFQQRDPAAHLRHVGQVMARNDHGRSIFRGHRRELFFQLDLRRGIQIREGLIEYYQFWLDEQRGQDSNLLGVASRQIPNESAPIDPRKGQ